MLAKHESYHVDDISNGVAIEDWNEAAEEFASFFAEGGSVQTVRSSAYFSFSRPKAGICNPSAESWGG